MNVVAGSPPLLHVESDADFDVLLGNIERSGYYDSAYFAAHSGYQPGRLGANFWFLAEMVRFFGPRRVLECGCGRGDALTLLSRTGVDVSGVDSSHAALSQAWPEVRGHLRQGDLTSVCRELERRGEAFDVVLGFDIWEHLHPERSRQPSRRRSRPAPKTRSCSAWCRRSEKTTCSARCFPPSAPTWPPTSPPGDPRAGWWPSAASPSACPGPPHLGRRGVVAAAVRSRRPAPREAARAKASPLVRPLAARVEPQLRHLQP